MLIQNIALVAEADGPNFSSLARVATALQMQVTRDLRPLWGVAAAVEAFARREDVPLGYWPIVITGVDPRTAHGVRLNHQGKPHARVASGLEWSLRASSACLDMLVNPNETQLVVGPSPRTPGALAEFLLEISGPCNPMHGYLIQDVLVSDFSAPGFYGLQRSGQSLLSVAGSVTAPFQLAPGGHLTWRDSISKEWWLRSYWGDDPVDTRLGALDWRSMSVREFVQLWRSQILSNGWPRGRPGAALQNTLDRFPEQSEFAAEVIEGPVAADSDPRLGTHDAARAVLLPPLRAPNAVRLAEVDLEHIGRPPLERSEFDRTTLRSHSVRDSVHPVARSAPPGLARSNSRRAVGLLLGGAFAGLAAAIAWNGAVMSPAFTPHTVALPAPALQPSAAVKPSAPGPLVAAMAVQPPAANGVRVERVKADAPAPSSTSRAEAERNRAKPPAAKRAAAGTALSARSVDTDVPVPERSPANGDAEIEALTTTRR